MSRVPVITSHCPFRWSSSPRPGEDFCGQCQRQVHNLDLMSQGDREEFLSGCQEKVCVSYTVRRPVRGAVALGASLAAVAALSGSASAGADGPEVVVSPDSPYCEEEELMGSVDTANLQWVDESEATRPDKADLPEIGNATWLPTPKV